MREKGFFPSLFDIGFTSLVTPRVIKVLYILGIVGIAIFAVISIISSFAGDPAAGIFVLLIVAPLMSLLALIWLRVNLEFFIVLFRIMENTGVTAAVSGGGMPGGVSAPAAGIGGGPQPGALGSAPPPTAQPAAAPPAAQPAPQPGAPGAGGPGQPAGWYPDPEGKARVRYWSGDAWTEHTAD